MVLNFSAGKDEMCFLLLKWEQAFLYARRLQELSLKKTTKYFQVSEKEQELSSWELSAYIVFMHELLPVEIHRVIVHACCSMPSRMCQLIYLVVYH